jgi:basic amino acid/polyamine antiporter, APA family
MYVTTPSAITVTVETKIQIQQTIDRSAGKGKSEFVYTVRAMSAEPLGNPAGPPVIGDNAKPQLVRGLTLFPAIALNMIDMIGVGPFITLPLMVAAMAGSRALYGWVAGAIVAMADGLIWAELGAALPRAGGSYEYLKETYGRHKLGRLLSFLFVFQLIFTAPVSMATGCVGLASYSAFLIPKLNWTFWQETFQFHMLGALHWTQGALQFSFLPVKLFLEVSGSTLLAMAAALLATFLVYRRIAGVARISKVLGIGVVGALAFVIFIGLTHFQRSLAFPPGWSTAPATGLWTGLSAAMLIALYDYWGYYNICFLGEEVVRPAKTIPRSMLLSIAIVAVLYILMNVSILGVLPTSELIAMANQKGNHIAAAARAAQVVYGNWAGTLVSVLVIFTAFASVFSLLAGYSRIPFAAAREGNFFSIFGKVDPKDKFPANSVLLLGGLAAVFCIFQLRTLIAALVVIRIMLMFFVQAVGAVVWRLREPDHPRPFKMWLYPLPVLIALGGFAIVLHDPDRSQLLASGLLLAALGIVIYLARSAKKREWPFGQRTLG